MNLKEALQALDLTVDEVVCTMLYRELDRDHELQYKYLYREDLSLYYYRDGEELMVLVYDNTREDRIVVVFNPIDANDSVLYRPVYVEGIDLCTQSDREHYILTEANNRYMKMLDEVQCQIATYIVQALKGEIPPPSDDTYTSFYKNRTNSSYYTFFYKQE